MTKILVVDDVPSNVTVLSWMLKHQGYTVCPASSGGEALELVPAERPDVILLDVSMPDMSGIEVCRRLKADPDLRLIPIILVTARTGEQDMVEGLNAGADDYIAKPVTREVLAARIRSALRTKAIYDELAQNNERLAREMAVRAKAEEELRHAQKLELVGQLAGGIAHEFNNLLQAIEGYTAYAMEGLAADEPRHQDLQQVLKASGRAADLTRQLLGFSRRRAIGRKSLDANRIVADLAKMIRPLIGAHIELETSLAPSLGTIHGDPGELQQALLNLCLNARDAMPSGGRLMLKTEAGPCRSPNCPEATPGDRVIIRVTDNGCGMSPEALQRAFEPFYTTKEVGHGTGLGLANVYGIVRQHGGMVHAQSDEGKGTTFTICLPASAWPDGAGEDDLPLEAGGAETILLAEDDPPVRELARRTLEDAGYTVLAARDGQEAHELYEKCRDEIGLLLLDAVMPGLTGPQLYARIREEKPEIKVLFATGYAPETALAGIGQDDDVRWISKPFDAAALLRAVRETLEETAACPALS